MTSAIVRSRLQISRAEVAVILVSRGQSAFANSSEPSSIKWERAPPLQILNRLERQPVP